ncbi:hypothetical protein NCS56_00642200 [Fusarium sp. Ph1]|nr:hypothetical protein NCS56_00642200 [Fusarium sp. Ph1]
MFQHMLIKVEPRYRNQASRLLWLCYAEQEARGWTRVKNNYALGLALVADYQLKPPPIEVWSEEKKVRLCRRLEGRLRSHCGGLLEVVKRRIRRIEQKFCFCGPIHDDWVDMEVGFMHRTVFEFLGDRRVWKLDCLRMEADSEFDAATDLSLIGLHLAMQSLHEHSPRYAQALEYLRDGVRWGSKADRDHPLSREKIFWKMMPFLDLLHTRGFAETRFSVWTYSLFKLARAHAEHRMGRFSHATLALVADAGAVNYLKEHPCLLTVAEDCEPISGFQPLFFDTIHRVSPLGFNWNRPSSSPPWLRRACSSDAVVRLLLSAGCDPNKFVSDGRGIIIYSPWALWLERKHDNLGTTIQEKLVALTTIESFVAAGATTRPDVWFDVETWIKESFWEPELIERSQSVLQSFRELKTDLVAGARRKRADSDELGVRGPETKRVCPC